MLIGEQAATVAVGAVAPGTACGEAVLKEQTPAVRCPVDVSNKRPNLQLLPCWHDYTSPHQ